MFWKKFFVRTSKQPIITVASIGLGGPLSKLFEIKGIFARISTLSANSTVGTIIVEAIISSGLTIIVV